MADAMCLGICVSSYSSGTPPTVRLDRLQYAQTQLLDHAPVG